MTLLRCSAMTCIYNKNQLCSRGEIDVIGENASHPDETSCGSFQDRKESSAKNSSAEGTGCEKIQIACQAHKCIYNDDQRCTASAIDVSGCHACDCRETKCDTFRCGC